MRDARNGYLGAVARRRARRQTLLGLLLVATLTAAPAHGAPCAEAPGGEGRCEAWAAAYNHSGGREGRGEDIGRAVATGGGRVFTVGVSRDDVTGSDAVMLAYDAASGTPLWSARETGPVNGYDTFSAVALTPDGKTVVATGRSDVGGGDLGWATVAYDAASGKRLWTARRDPTTSTDQPFAIGMSPDGSAVYVAGGDGVELPADMVTVAYDVATGAQRWIDVHGGTGFDHAWGMAVGEDGTVYVTGESEQSGRSFDAVTIAYAPDGARRWLRLFDAAKGSDAAYRVAVAGGTVAVAGRSRRASRDLLTIAYDAATGVQRWAAFLDGERGLDDVPDAPGVAVSPDGSRVFSTGSLNATTTLFDAHTVAYDAIAGSQLWHQQFDGRGLALDYPTNLLAVGDSVVMTGFTEFPKAEIVPVFTHSPRKSITIAYRGADGTTRWAARHDRTGVGGDVNVALAASADGKRVYTAGTFVFTGTTVYASDQAMGAAYDIGTLAYDL